MKKFLSVICLTVCLLITATPVKAQFQPMKTSLVLAHTYDSNGWYFALDTLAGKVPVMIQVYDSLGTWSNATITCDSVSRRSFANTRDEAWLNAMLQYQKGYTPFGLMMTAFFYKWASTGKLYYPSHYSKLLVYYR